MTAQPVPPAPRPVHPLDLGALSALVGAAFPGAGAGALDVEPMPGGASTRRYFRVRLGARAPGTVVGMFVPDGAKPEEVNAADDAKGGRGPGAREPRWPFLEVRDLLAQRGVDVPALHAEDTSHGWLVLEDLGDDTLANYLAARPERREALYVQAVVDLARAQRALASLPAGSVVATRAFDEALLHWEIDHFREWALDARGAALSDDERARFDGIARRMARRIAAWPRSFVHRDYQSRNLMVRAGERLCWIDFQDALLGPRVYDLVALLNDSYQTFDRPFVEARLDDFARAAGMTAAERAQLGREFDVVTVQRKLKDAGRFVFIDRVKDNPAFLRFVEPTIAKVRASLARLAGGDGDGDEDMRALSELLDRVLPRARA